MTATIASSNTMLVAVAPSPRPRLTFRKSEAVSPTVVKGP